MDDESMSEEEAEDLDGNLRTIYYKVITHVGKKLKEFDFFDESDFVDAGYADEDDD
jgi:hypothetical protein